MQDAQLGHGFFVSKSGFHISNARFLYCLVFFPILPRSIEVFLFSRFWRMLIQRRNDSGVCSVNVKMILAYASQHGNDSGVCSVNVEKILAYAQSRWK
jgi:hypothetical protein